MDTNGHEFLWSTEYTEETEASPQPLAKSEDFMCEKEIQKERLLTAACGSAVRHASRKRKQRHAEA